VKENPTSPERIADNDAAFRDANEGRSSAKAAADPTS
jgi:hypothetical protein